MLIKFLTNKQFILILVVIILAVTGLSIYERGQQNGVQVVEKVVKLQDTNAKGRIIVHLAGAVAKPGVYQVSENTHVYELILLAGGLMPDASIGKLNLAKVLENGDRVSITKLKLPQKKKKKSAKIENTSIKQPEYIININYANIQDLLKIPGIKETTAQAIINYRLKNGRFENLNDLTKVKGLGEKKFVKIKGYISI